MTEAEQSQPEGTKKKGRSKKIVPAEVESIYSPESGDEQQYDAGIGKVTIAPDVLITIARLTTLETPGVSRMHPVPAGVSRLWKGSPDGVDIDIQDDQVNADIYVVLKNDVNMREVSRTIQHNVSRSISQMVGLLVGRVNIHIEDIDFNMG